MKNRRIEAGLAVTVVCALALAFPSVSWAHCDALDGPVVLDARAALDQNDVTPVLKWVRPEDEAAVREAFGHAVAVRQLGPEAKDLADTFFFETLVRIHRAGEGAPYSGLRPAGSIEPAILRADQALESGSVDDFATMLAEHTAGGLRERFARAAEARKHAADSVEGGREYVEAYVAYVHYVEGLAHLVHGGDEHGGAERHP